MSAPLFDELFVANLAPDTTESDIKDLFDTHGAAVKECWVGHKKQLKGSANTSFSSVRVESHAEAVTAKKALHGMVYKDRNLVVKWAANQRLLWVGSLPDSVTNEALQAGFSQFGTVERALVVADASNPVSRRYGFVLFEEKRDAQKALSKCQEGALLFANSLEPVRVDWARIEDVYEGYSDSLVASKSRRGDVNPAVVAHLAAQGTQEHTMAMRIKQLQQQYEHTKAQLKAQLQAALSGNVNVPQNAPQMMAPPGMAAGGPQFMAQQQMAPMGQMAPMPMAPPPMQSQMNAMGMVHAPMAPAPMQTAMGAAQGTMPTIGLGQGMQPQQPAPMVNQNSMMGKSASESFNSVPPPSKAQMRSSTDLTGTLPGAKPPGSHDHRGIGFSGAASQPTSSQTNYSNTGAASSAGPRPPSTPYPNASAMSGYSQPATSATMQSYPPPTSMGAMSTGYGMGMGAMQGGQMQMQNMTMGGVPQAGYGMVPAVQSGYQTVAGTGMGTMGQFGMAQASPGMQGGMTTAVQQPMSGYTAPQTFGNYAPPPQQQQQMY